MAQNTATSAAALRDRLSALRMPSSAAPPFDPASAPDEPFELLADWFREALDGDVMAPHAMTLATSGSDGAVSARTVLLRDLAMPDDPDGGRLEFATSSDSPKGRQLGHDPRAALVFHWREQHRQVRVEGLVAEAPRERSEADFLSRTPATRAGIIAGRQSEPMPSPDEADRLIAGAAEILAVNPRFVPPSWTVYRVEPSTIEFWQGQPGVPQQRLLYRREGRGWDRARLWP